MVLSGFRSPVHQMSFDARTGEIQAGDNRINGPKLAADIAPTKYTRGTTAQKRTDESAIISINRSLSIIPVIKLRGRDKSASCAVALRQRRDIPG
jgi:hypothetical protein